MIDRLHDAQTLIARDLFQRDTALDRFIGMKVDTSLVSRGLRFNFPFRFNYQQEKKALLKVLLGKQVSQNHSEAPLFMPYVAMLRSRKSPLAIHWWTPS